MMTSVLLILGGAAAAAALAFVLFAPQDDEPAEKPSIKEWLDARRTDDKDGDW